MKAKLEHITKKYFIEVTDFEFFMLNPGLINSSYHVVFKTGKEKKNVVVQQLNTQIFEYPEKIANNINLVNAHLSKSDYHLALLCPYQTLKGENYHIEAGNYWRIFHFIDNSYTLEKCENTTQAFGAGQGFGQFLAALSSFQQQDFETILPDFHNAAHRWRQFLAAMKYAKANRFATAQQEIIFAVEHAYLIDFYKKIIEKIPVRVTHNDTKISNLLFDKNTHKPLAVIDLDTLQYGTILSEFGDMVRSYCNNVDEDEQDFDKISFKFDIFDALKKGFLSELESTLQAIEIENLDFGAKLTIFVQGLRFLTDFLNNDVYYKIKYSNHNLVRAKNQFALLKSFL